ncbi:MAG: hypothetical protein ACO1OB_21065 [Archangium sp.]
MDEGKIAEARQLLSQIARELKSASEAAEAAVATPSGDAAAWAHVQQLYTRFATAEQMLREMRRAIDDAFKG